MLIYAIDDEQAGLDDLREAIAQAEPDAAIACFGGAAEALAAAEGDRKPDVVFSDIGLPGMDGLSFAVRLKTEAPRARVVLVTGYSQYALEAYRRHINGYVMKPVTAAAIREELDALDLPRSVPKPDKLHVRCFGNFEVFWQGKPLAFTRSKTKELLACLVDRQGAYCTAGELIDTLWEDGAEVKSAKHYLRVLTSDLSATLDGVGLRDALLKKRGQWAIDRDALDCDYYRLLDGDMEARSAFQGHYMQQYSWAEPTAGELYFRFLENN